MLPRESAFKGLLGGDRALWGPHEHLLADIFDQVVVLNHNYARVHAKKGSRVPHPRFHRRPGVVVDEPGVRRIKGKALPLDRLKALTQRWRRGGGDP